MDSEAALVILTAMYVILTAGIVGAGIWAVIINKKAAQAAEATAKISKKMSRAQFLISAYQRYDELDLTLRDIGEWGRDNRAILNIYSDLNVDTDFRRVIDEHKLPNEIWQKSRRIKMYYHSFYKLYHNKIIDKEELKSLINNYGYDLLLEVVRLVDIYTFFDVRRDRPITQDEFDAGFRWYFELKKILPAYRP